MGVVFSFLFVV